MPAQLILTSVIAQLFRPLLLQTDPYLCYGTADSALRYCKLTLTSVISQLTLTSVNAQLILTSVIAQLTLTSAIANLP